MGKDRKFQLSAKFGLGDENLKKLQALKKHMNPKDSQKTKKHDSNKKDVKMSYEIVREKIKNCDRNNIIHFLKWATQYNSLDGTKINQMANFKQVFSFASEEDKRHLKNFKNTEFALAWFKDWFKEKNKSYTPNKGYKGKIEKITGLFADNITNDKLQAYVNNLIPYSFILHAKIELRAPYFSSDDDEFYLIQNPCLKEKVFKVPMVRGSGWKGVIAEAFRKLINENDNNNKKGMIQSYLRVFGAGSSEFRELEGMIDDFVNKGKTLSFNKLISYLLFELGLKLSKDDINKLKNEDEISNWLKNHILGNEDNELGKNSKKPIPVYLTTHKGRAIFYPTYFDRFSLEIINPHSRKTRAGTTPIHYEVVPEGSEGTLQIVYIPFDGILMEESELQSQVKNDIDFLTQAIEKAREIGIGAKEKLGWGRFRLTNKRFCVNRAIGSEDINDWKQCEVNNEQ